MAGSALSRDKWRSEKSGPTFRWDTCRPLLCVPQKFWSERKRQVKGDGIEGTAFLKQYERERQQCPSWRQPPSGQKGHHPAGAPHPYFEPEVLANVLTPCVSKEGERNTPGLCRGESHSTLPKTVPLSSIILLFTRAMDWKDSRYLFL